MAYCTEEPVTALNTVGNYNTTVFVHLNMSGYRKAGVKSSVKEKVVYPYRALTMNGACRTGIFSIESREC
jgi:hypothetical protein